MRTYKTEFPSYDDELAFPKGWIDTSWHNDACPSFGYLTPSGEEVRIYCDYVNPELREVEGKRFNVVIDDGLNFTQLEGFDTLQEALNYCGELK